MLIKCLMLTVFFAVMIGIGLYCRSHAADVKGFVLGGRSVGPWLTAFAYGTSYFSAVIFVGYAGQFGWKYGIASTWIGIGVDRFGAPDPNHEPVSGLGNDAGIFRTAFSKQTAENRCFFDHLSFFDSLYSFSV